MYADSRNLVHNTRCGCTYREAEVAMGGFNNANGWKHPRIGDTRSAVSLGLYVRLLGSGVSESEEESSVQAAASACRWERVYCNC